MKAILLLGMTFIRQNRWLTLAFVAWPFLLSAFEWSPYHAPNPDDISAMLQQEIFYGLGIAMFLASSAIYNEKRSRRILGVLSKGVSRAQYLVGLLAGSTVFGFLYFIAIAASLLWVLASFDLTQIGILLICGLFATAWIVALALLFSVVLHPILAAVVAGAIAFAPLALNSIPALLPLSAIVRTMTSTPAQHFPSLSIFIAALESAAFVLIGSGLFQYSDVAVNVE
jgi:ABC-type transport system involved in multi-copper enzyme maturation permease subunit